MGFAVRLAVGTALLAAPTAVSGAETAAGLWAQVDDKTGRVRSHVRIVERGGQFSGSVARIYPGPGEPAHPVCDLCKGALKNRPILGMTFMQGFTRAGHSYSGGTVLDPETGETYRGTMTLGPDGRTLELRGYVMSPIFGRSQVWRRID